MNINHVGLNVSLLRFTFKSIEIENKYFLRLVTNHNPYGFILKLCNLEGNVTNVGCFCLCGSTPPPPSYPIPGSYLRLEANKKFFVTLI